MIDHRARRWLTGLLPRRDTVKQDLVAGVPGAISSVPDGMAAGILAGVSPVHGLYASIFGPIGGGLTASSKMMVITTTSAAALAAGSAVAAVPAERRPQALFLLTVLAGALMIAAAIARLGRFTRFVPHSVMIGFLTGVAVNIALGQLPDLTGSDVTGDVPVAKAWHLLLDLGSANLSSTAVGVSALAILIVLGRTRVGPYASLVALAAPSIVVILTDARAVQRVSDVGEIPSGLPAPALPRLAELSSDVVMGAFAVAALVLIQGAGVSESAPNPDGTRSRPNRDFLAQGIANVLSGLFRGQPVGGSVGQTAISLSSGARTNWAAIFAGIWMATILLLFSGVVGKVAMPTLAAILIAAAVGSLRTGQVLAIARTSRIARIAIIATFVATLLLPVAAAVGLGVIIALLMQLNQEALDLRVVRLVPTEAGFVEQPAPQQLASREVLLMDVYGSLFYAGARTLQTQLPDPGSCEVPAVVLRLRGRAQLGATSYAVLSDYAARLAAAGGRLYLSGVSVDVIGQIHRNATVERAGVVRVYEATSIVGESSLDAYHDAERWMAAQTS